MTNIEIIKLQPVDGLARILDSFNSGEWCNLQSNRLNCLIERYEREGKPVISTKGLCKTCIKKWLKDKYSYDI